MVCCFACRSHPRIFISASFVPSLFGCNRKVYSGRREADLVMSSVTAQRAWLRSVGVPADLEKRRRYVQTLQLWEVHAAQQGLKTRFRLKGLERGINF